MYADNFYFNDGDDVRTLINDAGEVDFSKMKRIDLGGIVLDGETGNINFTGAGSITWGDNTPVKYQFGTSSTGPWHSTMAANDKYRRDSLDGGTTWGDPYQFRGTDGYNGNDASVTRSNIVRAMLNAIEEDGLYTTTIKGKQCLGINATAIKSGVIQGIDIFGGRFGDITTSGDPNVWIKMGKDDQNFYGFHVWHSGYSTPTFSIDDNGQGQTSLLQKGYQFLEFDSYDIIPHGNWDFSEATVTGIYARFA